MALIALALGVLTLGTFVAPSVRAQANTSDGLYNRWQGDFAVVPSAGAGIRHERDASDVAPIIDCELLFLNAAGPFVGAELAPNAANSFLSGVRLRPLFPAFFLSNLSTGAAFFDLMLQSIHLELGAAISPLKGDTGVGVTLGTGLDLPIYYGRSGVGVALRLGARHQRFRAADSQGGSAAVNRWTFYSSLAVPIQFDVGITTPRR